MDRGSPGNAVARGLPEWVNGLGSADAPEVGESVEHGRAREQEEMSWELRTDTVGPVREYAEPSLGEMQASHARQLTHYKNLLIRAQSASSNSLHDALTKLHDLEGKYARLEAEHARCREIQAVLERDYEIAGHLNRGDLGEAIKKLSKTERVRVLGVMAEACDPSDIDAQIVLLEKYKRTRFDILGRLTPELAVQVMLNLQLNDILNLRLVSPGYLALTGNEEMWRHLCHQRDSSCSPTDTRSSGSWEAEYRRLVKRDPNWRLGEAQRVVIYPGHKDHVTSIKLAGTTLISGSSDGTICIWDIPLRPSLAQLKPSTVLSTGSVSCLDYSPSKGILAAGFSDLGRVQCWHKAKDSWVPGQTLAGHSHGIRAVTLNDRYLVSAGVDKVLVVWNHETGEKFARFGQQPNISAGLHLVHDRLISVTIDGVVRAYDIGRGGLIRQYKISDLCKQGDLGLEERMRLQEVGGGQGGIGVIQWASGSGSTLTCGTKTTMIAMRWEEVTITEPGPHVTTARKPSSLTAGIRRTQRSAIAPVSSPNTPQRQRILPMKLCSPISSSPTSTSPAPKPSPLARATSGPERGSPKSAKSGPPSISARMTSSLATTAATSTCSDSPFHIEPEMIVVRLVPDLSQTPNVTEVRQTPEVERGVFDPVSSRLVASTRFAARAGSEKKIYISGNKSTMQLGELWTKSAATLRLDTIDKRPTCLVMDSHKIVYGCSDGSIVVVAFC